jgi:alpha-D-ribose 1-methylphosphonate 5-triphosphate synthase subunit PhnH
VRALGLDPVQDTRQAFDGLLDAMSRPGTVQSVPEPADHAVVSTLVDHEVTASLDDATLRDALDRQGRLDAAPPESADIVHVRDREGFDVRECKRGSLVEPSEGATVVYRVDAVETGQRTDCSTVSLAGPGVDGTTTLSVSLSETALSRLATAQSDYPQGVDAILTTETRVAALPRSVTMEGY